MRWFGIHKNIDVTEPVPVKVYGSRFSFLIIKDHKGILSCYVLTGVSPNALKAYYKVEEKIPVLPTQEYHYAIAQCTRISNRYEMDLRVSDLPSLIDALPPNSGVAIMASLDAQFIRILHHDYKNAQRKKIKYQRALRKEDSLDLFDPYPTYIDALERRLNSKENIYLVTLLIFTPDRESLLETLEEAERLIHPPPSWKKRKVKCWEDLLKLIKPPKVTFGKTLLDGLNILSEFADKILFGIKEFTCLESVLESWLQPPNPEVHKVYFSRGLKIPALPQKEHGIRLGTLENGTTLTIDLDDLKRHVHIMGGTGTGKSTLIKLMITRLREKYKNVPMFIIDPHGTLADELARLIPDALYFHPIHAPFGVNPFELPKGFTDEQSITIGRGQIVDIFSEVLQLPEEAQYVKLILRTAITYVYKKGIRAPTIKLLCRVIEKMGTEGDKFINDPDIAPFIPDLMILYEKNPQSFVSTKARLERFAGDPTISRLTNYTTVPFDDIIENGKIAIFSLPITELGNDGTSLIASTLLMKIWHKILERNRINPERKIPVIVVCDEFQMFKGAQLIEEILTQARKFNLHIIISHQFRDQLVHNGDTRIWNAVLNNAGMKIFFNITASDELKNLDPILGEKIVSILPVLPRGYAIVKLATIENSTPFVVKFDHPTLLPLRDLPGPIGYIPPPEDPTDEQFEQLFNPLLKMIDKPNPLRQLILFHLYDKGDLFVGDLYNLIPCPKDKIDREITKLSQEGLIIVERPVARRGRLIRLKENVDPFEEFYKASPSEMGKIVIREIVMNYFRTNAYIAPVKQTPGQPRPDLIVIPYHPDSIELDYDRAIAVEIEIHPTKKKEQVIQNVTKETTSLFNGIHVWCSEKDKKLVEDLITTVDDEELRNKITIFSFDYLLHDKVKDIEEEGEEEHEVVEPITEREETSTTPHVKSTSEVSNESNQPQHVTRSIGVLGEPISDDKTISKPKQPEKQNIDQVAIVKQALSATLTVLKSANIDPAIINAVKTAIDEKLSELSSEQEEDRKQESVPYKREEINIGDKTKISKTYNNATIEPLRDTSEDIAYHEKESPAQDENNVKEDTTIVEREDSSGDMKELTVGDVVSEEDLKMAELRKIENPEDVPLNNGDIIRVKTPDGEREFEILDLDKGIIAIDKKKVCKVKGSEDQPVFKTQLSNLVKIFKILKWCNANPNNKLGDIGFSIDRRTECINEDANTVWIGILKPEPIGVYFRYLCEYDEWVSRDKVKKPENKKEEGNDT